MSDSVTDSVSDSVSDPVSDPGQVRRVPPADELRRGDERLVLVEDRAVRVVGLGPVILDLTEDWVDLPGLVRLVTGRFDVPAGVDPRPLLEAAVAALVAEGLLERDG